MQRKGKAISHSPQPTAAADDDNNNNNKLHFNICNEIWVKSKNKHQYDQVSKLVETDHEGRVTVLWNQQSEPTELLLTINRTAQKVNV